MALFMDIPRPSEPNTKQLANYMYQLEDMLRHVLSNIDTDNLAQGSKIIQVVEEDSGTAKALKKTTEEVKSLNDQRWKTDRAYAGMAKAMTGQRDGKKINIVLTLQNGEAIQTGFFDTAGISAEDVGVRLPISGAPAKYEDGQVTVNLELYSYAGGTGELTFSKGDSVTFRDEKGNGLAYDAGYAAGYEEAKKAVTVEGVINEIRNTAANYFFAQGQAVAYVDGVQVASDTFSASQEINVGQ